MATLICTRGRAFPLARLAERLRCPRCGSRHVAVCSTRRRSRGDHWYVSAAGPGE